MQLHPIMESFYTSILHYAGLELKDNIVVNTNEKMGDFTLDKRHVTLPYFENLKRPEGKHIFHPLHESYVKPETALFSLYRKRLVCEINLKLIQLFVTITHICVSVELQGKIKSAKLAEFISEFKDMDMVFVENLMRIVKASKEVNDEAFVVDVFLKKNGEIGQTPYSATGKINFILYNEVVKTLKESAEYRVFGCKVRKKDLVILQTMFEMLFEDIGGKDLYTEGTDNRVFRYLNALLKTSYLVTSRITELSKLISTMDDATLINDLAFDHIWTTHLEELYSLTSEIRMIPNQTDTSVAEQPSHRLAVDESVAAHAQPVSPDANQLLRQASQPMPVPVQQPMPMQNMQPMAPQMGPADPNDILRNIANSRNPQQQWQPQPMPMQQPPMPGWMREQMMREQGIPPQQMHPQYPQQMMAPQQLQQYPQQQMMPQPYPQPYPQQMMPQPYPQQFPNQGYPQPGYGYAQQPPGLLDPSRMGRAGFPV